VFNTFVLNKDPDCSEYMPYDDVSYPRLRQDKDRETQAFAELESLWMVGFLHHNKKSNDGDKAKELQPFLRLPGSTVLPQVEKDLSRIIDKDLASKIEEVSASEAKRAPEVAAGRGGRGRRGGPAAASGRKEAGRSKRAPPPAAIAFPPSPAGARPREERTGGVAAAPFRPDRPPLLARRACDLLASALPYARAERPPSLAPSNSPFSARFARMLLRSHAARTLLRSHAARTLLRSQLSPRIPDPDAVVDPGAKDHRTKMSDEERMRLDQLGDQLVKKKKQMTGMQMYQAANYKIRRVLKDRKPAKKAQTLKSGLMEDMFEVERRETQGATIIQKFWHKYLIVKQLKENVQKGKKIKVIQALVRGMITRKWLSLWYKNRFLMIIQWQARFRRFLSNKRWDAVCEIEEAASVKCQKGVRMFLGKCVAYWKRLHLAAERVQCMWRGCVARARSDKLWLDKQVSVLQAFTR
jgi:hypothetical protein